MIGPALDALDVCMESGDRWPTMCIWKQDFEAWNTENGARLLWRRDVGQPVRSVGETLPALVTIRDPARIS